MPGEVSALGAALSWAVSSFLLKGLSLEFRPIQLNALRCGFAMLFALALFLALENPAQAAQLSFRSLGLLVASGILGITIAESLYLVSLSLMDVSKAFPISLSGYAFFTFILAVLLLGEEISWPMLLGSAVLLLGIYLVLSPGGSLGFALRMEERERRGLLLLLLACGGWAAAVIMARVALTEAGIVLSNAVRLPLATLMLLGLAAPRGLGRVSGRSWGAIAAAGVLSYGLGAVFFLEALKLLGAAKATVLSMTSPVFLLPLAVFFLREKVSLARILGIALSILGVALIV